MRAFIALDIPPGIQDAIRATTGSLRKETGSLVRWTLTENLHLTLKFLGEISSDGLAQLTQMLRAEAVNHIAFEMHIGRLGAFPNLKRARVIFIGIEAPAGLEALARGIESACTRLGYDPEERDFHPHLTIGRVKPYLSADEGSRLRRALESSTIDSLGTARVDSVQVYKSDLKPGGAVYTRLFSAPLQNSNAGEAEQPPG